MEPIKAEILAYLKRAAGKSEHGDVSLVALDRYLVYVKQEETFVGKNLGRIIDELVNEELLRTSHGSYVALTERGAEVADRLP